MKHSHYFKEWFGKIDIYRLCELFEIKRKPIDHAVKKLICAGNRGSKDELKDYQEAIDSINRCIEMIKEDQEAQKERKEKQQAENLKLNKYIEKTFGTDEVFWPEDETRIEIIGPNGNDGLHYDVVEKYQDDFEE